MERFSIVVFRLIEPRRGTAVRETGGGMVLIPDPKPEDWHARVAALVKRRFKHPLGLAQELGVATLDRASVERHCQREGDLFWQGGDS